MKKKYYFVYKTTNLVNQKFYIGVHATTNINDGYLGSGKRLGDAIKHYGKENFLREILRFFDSYEGALSYEQELVTEDLILREDCYNMTVGGGKPPTMYGEDHPFYGKTREDSRQRMLSDDNPSKGKVGHESATYNKVSVVDANGYTLQVDKTDPRYLSGELVPVNKGKITVRDKDGKVFHVTKSDPRYLSGELTHITKGLVLTCPHCNKTGGSTMKRWHFNNCKFRKEGL